MSSEMPDIVICRTCIKECEKFKSLYKEGLFFGEKTTLASLLSYIADLDISADDDYMPGHICLKCIQHLTTSFAFKKMVTEADKELRSHQTEDFYELETKGSYKVEFSDLADQRSAGSLSFHSLQTTNVTENDCSKVSKTLPVQSELADKNVFRYQTNVGFSEAHQKPDKNVYTAKLLSSRMHSDARTESEKKSLTAIKTKRKEPLNTLKWECKVCNKKLSNRHSFKYHMQLHSEETPFICNLCGEKFKTRNSYEGHLMVHDPNNPNTCLVCGKVYRQPSSLKTHMLIHTGERPFQCDICGKGMTQKSGYKKHMLIHTGEKPHTCDVCGRVFRYSSNLNAHKRCHSGERPYSCSNCEKRFSTSEQMKRHFVVHTGERPYSCNFCGKTFKRRSSIVAHRHIHAKHFVAGNKKIE